MAGRQGVVLNRLDRGVHRAAAVAQHKDRLDAENGRPYSRLASPSSLMKLPATRMTKALRPLIEDQLGRNAGIRAAHDGREGLLPCARLARPAE